MRICSIVIFLLLVSMLQSSCKHAAREPEVTLTLADIKMPDAERPFREKNKVKCIWTIVPFRDRMDTFSWTRFNKNGLETNSRSGLIMSSHDEKKYNTNGWPSMEIYSSCNTTRIFCYYYNDTHSRTLYKLDVEDYYTGRFQNAGHDMRLGIYKYDQSGLIYECAHVASPWSFTLNYYAYDEQSRLVKTERYSYIADRESYPFRSSAMSDPYYTLKGYHYTGDMLDSSFFQMFGRSVNTKPTTYQYEDGLMKTSGNGTYTVEYKYGYYD